MRKSNIIRNTNETNIEIILNIDGEGKFSGKTCCGFLDHMLELFTYHGGFDLDIEAEGDIHIDYHHLVEDVGIALGNAFSEALGELKGINRYGSFILPMDEALILVALDISGRNHLEYNIVLEKEKVGDFDTELVKEFFLGFSRSLKMTLHFKQFSGENTHHIIEAMYKGFGRAMKIAVDIDENKKNQILSTKGLL